MCYAWNELPVTSIGKELHFYRLSTLRVQEVKRTSSQTTLFSKRLFVFVVTLAYNEPIADRVCYICSTPVVLLPPLFCSPLQKRAYGTLNVFWTKYLISMPMDTTKGILPSIGFLDFFCLGWHVFEKHKIQQDVDELTKNRKRFIAMTRPLKKEEEHDASNESMSRFLPVTFPSPGRQQVLCHRLETGRTPLQ